MKDKGRKLEDVDRRDQCQPEAGLGCETPQQSSEAQVWLSSVYVAYLFT
jgi:hypothetical protein